MRRIRLLSLSLCLLLTPLLLQAEESAQVTIEADRLELNQQSGVSIYQGNVRLQQGSLVLRAERLELQTLKGRIQKASAVGSPVRLEQRDPATDQLIRAEASRVEYQIGSGQLELSGDAHLWRGEDEFSGKRLTYDSKKRSVKAYGSGDGDDNGRVRVILQAPKESSDE